MVKWCYKKTLILSQTYYLRQAAINIFLHYFMVIRWVNRSLIDLRVWHPCPINVSLLYYPIDNIQVMVIVWRLRTNIEYMIYNVFGGTLNFAQSINQFMVIRKVWLADVYMYELCEVEQMVFIVVMFHAYLYVHSWRSILVIRETLSLRSTKTTQSICCRLVLENGTVT